MLKSYFLIIFTTLLCLSCTNSQGGDGNEDDSEAEQIDRDSSTDNRLDDSIDEDTDSSSDTRGLVPGTSCDGDNVDCYTECRQCAYENDCQNEVNTCKGDTGCNAYLTCTENQCCPNGVCVTGTAMRECVASCQTTHDVSNISIYLYEKLNQCVTCYACSASCFQNQPEETIPADICTPEYPSIVPPCYPYEAQEGETSCFGWAGWGGPCTEATAACKNDPQCSAVEGCISISWPIDGDTDNSIITDYCLSNAEPETAILYWAYMQCIYCDACNIACAADAGSKRCSTYVFP